MMRSAAESKRAALVHGLPFYRPVVLNDGNRTTDRIELVTLDLQSKCQIVGGIPVQRAANGHFLALGFITSAKYIGVITVRFVVANREAATNIVG